MTLIPPPGEPSMVPIPAATSMTTVADVPHPVQSATANPVVLIIETAMNPASPNPVSRCAAIAAAATANSST